MPSDLSYSAIYGFALGKLCSAFWTCGPERPPGAGPHPPCPPECWIWVLRFQHHCLLRSFGPKGVGADTSPCLLGLGPWGPAPLFALCTSRPHPVHRAKGQEVWQQGSGATVFLSLNFWTHGMPVRQMTWDHGLDLAYS